jgi:hypothetical protein
VQAVIVSTRLNAARFDAVLTSPVTEISIEDDSQEVRSYRAVRRAGVRADAGSHGVFDGDQ